MNALTLVRARVAAGVQSLSMERLDRTAVRAVRALIGTQPVTEAKIAFAWALAAGPALARAAKITWRDGELRVEATSDTWRKEILRAKPMLETRIDEILGPGVVRRISLPTVAGAAEKFQR